MPTYDSANSSPTMRISLELLNYYPASADNRNFGLCKLHELGNGNKEFVSIRGNTISCFPSSTKEAVKQYGNDVMYYYDKHLGPDGITPEEGGALDNRIFSDILKVDSCFKAAKVYVPSDLYKGNFGEVMNYAYNVKNYAYEVQNNRAKLKDGSANSPNSYKEKHKKQCIKNFYQNVVHNGSLGTKYDGAQTSNEYIKGHIDNIFPYG